MAAATTTTTATSSCSRSSKAAIEPPSCKHSNESAQRKVSVVYYLCRNGHLEHPHFIEVPLSSSEGLYLRDVINCLNLLRGKGMAALYSWSVKRSYKNGFVWHDLGNDDLIHPVLGQEYVLKGSELLETAFISSSSSRKILPDGQKLRDDVNFPAENRRRNQSWSATDLHEYKVYKNESSSADAATQTDDLHLRRRIIGEIEEEEEEKNKEAHENRSTELDGDEISPPPPSSSSPETLEALMKADGKFVLRTREDMNDDVTAKDHPIGRIKASSVLRLVIPSSCGSISFKDCGPGHGKVGPSRGTGTISWKQTQEEFWRRKAEDNTEYFSGSLIEVTKKKEFPALHSSNSGNADR